MGITTSKSVNVALSKAITTTSQANDSRVDRVLFQDPASAQCLQQAWTELLPPLRKTFVVRNSRSSKSRSSAKDRALKKALVDEKIHCHSFVHIHLTKWSVDPSTFLDRTEQHRHTPRSGGQLYQLLTHITNSVVIDQICLRFCLMLFSEWKSHFCQSRLRSAKSLFIDDILRSGIAVGHRRDVIEKVSTAWASSGARYAQLASDLGGKGCLMLLPDNITPYEWERGLPSSGPDHDNMVASLKKRGICEEATRTNANKVADAVWKYLQASMESARSNADHERHGVGSQGGPLAHENAFEGHGASNGPADSPGGNVDSMQVLLTAAEQIAGQIPVSHHPSATSSSIVDQSDPTPSESCIPFNESALCNARWSIPNHTDLFDFNNDQPVTTASQQHFDLNDDPAVAAATQFFSFDDGPVAAAASQQRFDFNNDPAVTAASQQLFGFDDGPGVAAASHQLLDFNNDPAVTAASQQIFNFDYDPAVTAAAASQQFLNFENDLAVTPAASNQQLFDLNAVTAASQQFFDFNDDPAVTAAAASQQLSDFNNDPQSRPQANSSSTLMMT